MFLVYTVIIATSSDNVTVCKSNYIRCGYTSSDDALDFTWKINEESCEDPERNNGSLFQPVKENRMNLSLTFDMDTVFQCSPETGM